MAKNVTFIGDVHGKLDRYYQIISSLHPEAETYCVGDFGGRYEWEHWSNNKTDRHHIVMGNHDYIPYRFLLGEGNFSYNPELDIFCVRGAASIDKSHRIEGFDWFREEELTYAEGMEAIAQYESISPSTLLTHNAPQSIVELFFGYKDKSTTTQILQEMFEIHKPKLWVFGHHHRRMEREVDGCLFVCLEELGTYSIRI
jgi:predicted phosphodiesterase